MIVPVSILLGLFGLFFFFGIWSENARRGERQDNDEYDYGHNVGNYHSDGEGDL